MTRAPKVTLVSSAPTAVRSANRASVVRQSVFNDIRAKWEKFSEAELSRLKGRDDLAGQIVAKYGIEKTPAERAVDSLMDGRQI